MCNKSCIEGINFVASVLKISRGFQFAKINMSKNKGKVVVQFGINKTSKCSKANDDHVITC